MEKIYDPLPMYRNKVIRLQKEKISLISREEREKALVEAHYNLFRLKPKKVYLDFLTDSGTGAISPQQWIQGDKAPNDYASNSAREMLDNALRVFTGKEIIFLAHQGRAAERLLAEQFLRKGNVVLSNHLFDTTRANFEWAGAQCIDMPETTDSLSKEERFRGNIDLDILEWTLSGSHLRKRVKAIVMTLTDNTGGAQPASFENIRIASDIARKYNILFIIDASRISQNSYYVWKDESQKSKSIADIIRDTFALADIGYMSLKKNGAYMGGSILTNPSHMSEKKKAFVKHPDWLEKLDNRITITEGLSHGYGGIPGRDMAIAAVGLEEMVRAEYLEKQIGQPAYLQEKLIQIGIPIMNNNLAGGHGVYIDAGELLAGIVPKDQFPGHAVAVALFKRWGIRTCEVGSLMFGSIAPKEILRVAFPAWVYEKEHLDYLARAFEDILEYRDTLKGFSIKWQPKFLRHFSCHLEPV